MSRSRPPHTAATRALQAAGASYQAHEYAYQDKGGTRVSSLELGVSEHIVIKTLVMEGHDGKPLLVLMHGDARVSTRELARQAVRRKVSPCRPEVAERHTGYQVGGTSPFGLRKRMPVFAEASILTLDQLFINGGKRGFLVSMSGPELNRLLSPTPVSVAILEVG